MPELQLEMGAELEGWRKFIGRFEIALIGASLKKIEEKKVWTRKKTQDANIEQLNLEQRKVALSLDSMGEVGMNIFETWDVEI